MPLGVLVALVPHEQVQAACVAGALYISVMRGTPLMLQMFAIYFRPVLPVRHALGTDSKFEACVVAFIINYAGVLRGNLSLRHPVDSARPIRGCRGVGLHARADIFEIVIPQVVKRILPAMGNEIITLVKDTSLAFAIGVVEMFSTAKALVASQVSMLPFVIAARFTGCLPSSSSSCWAPHRKEPRLLPRLALGQG